MREPRRPSLFDLRLEPPEEQHDHATSEEPHAPPRGAREQPAATSAAPGTPAADRLRPEERLPLFPDEDDPAEDEAGPSAQAPDSPVATTQRSAPMPASLGARWRAGGLDLLLHAALALGLAFGSWFLGAPFEGFETLGLAVFVAVFSFLYTVIPLAFWGRTLGMTRVGLVATGGDQERSALTFGQTALRWLGGLLTLALLGLPTLLALLGDRSLTDRLSGSRTWRLPRSGDR